MGVIVEKFNDENGIIWPKQIAPYHVYLIGIGQEGDVALKKADELYIQLQEAGIEVLYDDRDTNPGAKFKDADLLGIPVRLVVGAKSLEQGGVEMKFRTEFGTTIVPVDEIAVKVVEYIRL
jgi:prolyl-tRNA synthetase